jgi:hypothetical protein
MQSLRKNLADLIGRIDNLFVERADSNQGLDVKIRGFIEDVRSYALRKAEAIFGRKSQDIEEEKKEMPA